MPTFSNIFYILLLIILVSGQSLDMFLWSWFLFTWFCILICLISVYWTLDIVNAKLGKIWMMFHSLGKTHISFGWQLALGQITLIQIRKWDISKLGIIHCGFTLNTRVWSPEILTESMKYLPGSLVEFNNKAIWDCYFPCGTW